MQSFLPKFSFVANLRHLVRLRQLTHRERRSSIDRMQLLAENGVFSHMYLGHEFVDRVGGKPVSELHGKEEIVTFLENSRDIALKYFEFCKENRHLTLEECIDAIDEKYGCTKAPFMPFLKRVSISQFLAQLN